MLCILMIYQVSARQEYFLPVIPPFNLKSDDRYTKYLPARVRALKAFILQNGLLPAIDSVRDDRDLESYLFILSCEKPYKLLAYSRESQLFGKTAPELQPFIFTVPVKDSLHDVSVIFDRWVSTGRKGDTYVSYFWRLSDKESIRIQTAYVSLITIGKVHYVIGAAVFAKYAPDHIILPHYTKTLISRFKENSIEQWLNIVNNDPDPELYFFVDTLESPNRWIAHGRNPWLVGKTVPEAQKKLFATCKEEVCDLQFTFNKLIRQALRGGGFVAYPWRARPNDPIKLKISYVGSVIYKKKKLFVGTGYTPLDFPDRLLVELPAAVDTTLKLITEVGLKSAVSVLKKTNNEKLYIFIIEQNPPYRNIVDFTASLQTTAEKATAFARKSGATSVKDYTKFRSQLARFAKEGGGFYAYVYEQFLHDLPNILKIAYIKSFSFNGVDYFMGATYKIFD